LGRSLELSFHLQTAISIVRVRNPKAIPIKILNGHAVPSVYWALFMEKSVYSIINMMTE
jgi:hypothetical protein